MSQRSFRVGVMAAIALALSAAPARANGAFPDEFSLHFPLNAPHRILMGANFGLLVSEDDGATWRYSCEPWVVAGSNAALASVNVSFYQVTAGGAIMADAQNMTRSTDVGCNWPQSTGAVAGEAVTDFFPDPTDPNFVAAIVTNSGGSYIVASHDGGATFDAQHLLDAPNQLLSGIESARSQTGVIYATSIPTSGGGGTFHASTDFGAHWTDTPLNLAAGTQPRILAVDPVDAKKVYLRLLAGVTDGMSVTTDGGGSFATVLTIHGQFSSFLRASDGAVYAGTLDGQLYVQPAGSTSFQMRSGPHLRCLGQRPGTTRIYACADMVVDGFSLGYSDDNGASFHPMMSFTQLLGPLTCAPVQANCAAHWQRIQGVLGIVPDAGPTGGGGGGPPPSGGGSHCASAGADLWGAFAALAFACRKRRRA